MPIYSLDGISPKLPPEGKYFVAPDAHVIGNVEIGENVGIWFGAVLRGDTEPIRVGKGSNIQEGALFHTDPGFPVEVGEGCTIGHHAIVHGATVGDNCLVGMGATLLNGVRLGNNCLVGANALVTENKAFEDNSLIVGAPARAVRTLDEAGINRLRLSAMHYVQRYRKYLAGLKRIG